MNFEDIISVLRVLINKNTTIVGHSLDTDLKVLQLVHARVIDTAALFPHNSALPYKIALKTLAKDYLGVDIQDGEGGISDYRFYFYSSSAFLIFGSEFLSFIS